jgi:hypothetical protein
VKFDLGLIGQISLSDRISIRPSVLLSFDQSDIDFERRRSTGAPVIETVSVKTTSLAIPIPFIFRLSNKNVAPFISAGPTFSFLSQKNDINADRLPMKKFDVSGDAGFGVDIGLAKASVVISPEIKYSRGLIDLRDNNFSGYSTVVTKLNRQAFTFSVYLRRR